MSQDEKIDRLLAGIDALGQHVALLAQSVAQLLGEEMGTPVESDSSPERLDLDGNPY